MPLTLNVTRLILTVIVAASILAACGGSAREASDAAGLETTLPPDVDSTVPAVVTLDDAPQPTPTATYPPDTLAGFTVALDSGHGGGDEGAMGFCVDVEVLEVDVNDRVREMLTDLLLSVGAEVYLVPQTPGREERVASAEAAGADILLSIHHNGYEDPSFNYTMTFVSDDADMLLASYVHPQLVEALALPNSQIQFEEFGMTSNGEIPSILTEATFITNDIEACNFVHSQSRIRAESEALFQGIVAYARGEGLASR